MIRPIAVKLPISQILKAEIMEELSEPSYFLFQGVKISRLNIIAIIVATHFEVHYHTFFVDDGTGSIPLRIFENNHSHYIVGDCVQIIGRPRLYGSEKYIIPEIMKKSSPEFLALRKKEIEGLNLVLPQAAPPLSSPPPLRLERSSEKILQFIQEHDTGDGVYVEDIYQYDSNSEKIITRFLEQGLIFETRPGTVKILH